MSYYTCFDGSLDFDRPLDPEFRTYLERFFNTKHFRLDESDISSCSHADRLIPTLPDFEKEGKFYVSTGSDDEPRFRVTSMSYCTPADDCPSLYCDMEVRKPTGHYNSDIPENEIPEELIIHDGAEDSEYCTDWIEWLIKYIIAPAGYTLNGEITWQGEDADDNGVIIVKNNVLKIRTVDLELIENTPDGIICQADKIPANMFEFFIHKRREFKNGTASYCIGISPVWDTNQSLVIKTLHGTLNDAKAALDDFVEKYDQRFFQKVK